MKPFKATTEEIMSFWKDRKFAEALSLVDELLPDYPGNSYLYTVKGALIQLQEETKYTLQDALDCLKKAAELQGDPELGNAYLELGFYLYSNEEAEDLSREAFAKARDFARRTLQQLSDNKDLFVKTLINKGVRNAEG